MNTPTVRYTVLLFAFAVMLAFLVSSCGQYIYTEIPIEARPETIWAILADNENYPTWNPYHVKVEGTLAIGATLLVDIHKPNGKELTIHPKVMRIIPEKELSWGGGIKGLFFGEHVFLIEQSEHGITRVIQKEYFKGIFVPFASLEAIEEGYNAMNQALKARAEALEQN